ncbi:MAG: polyphenol oxidase family protein [Pseudomonadota bacterium]
MIRCRENGLVYYRFELFEPYPELQHGVFTRVGGVSPPPRQGLNLAFAEGEPEAYARKNLDLAAEALGFEGLSFAGQAHGDQALVIRAEDNYRPRSRRDVIRGYDALITPDPAVGLLLKLADCQGVILYDPGTRVVALVHSGWRGSVKNVLGRTVRRLEAEFGVRPADLLAGVSPSLGPCCAEFVNYERELPESFWGYGRGDLFDFWAISRDQLTEAGVRPEKIEVSGMCTKCGDEGFYSYRREGITGRFGLVAGRLPE